jgi:hypothetical protein
MVGVWAPVGGFSFVLGYFPATRGLASLVSWRLLGVGVFIWTFFSWVCTIRRGTFHGYGYHEIFGRRWLLGGFYLFFFSNPLIAFSFVSESR